MNLSSIEEGFSKRDTLLDLLEKNAEEEYIESHHNHSIPQIVLSLSIAPPLDSVLRICILLLSCQGTRKVK